MNIHDHQSAEQATFPSRRRFLAATAMAAIAVTVGSPFVSALGAATPKLGRITITQGSHVKIHTYTAPDAGWMVNSHIIELSDQLIIVDTQYLLPCAKELAEYADSLRKPISRIYISHFHPDHDLGSVVFSAPLYALPDVRAKVNKIGDRLAKEEGAKFPGQPGMIADHMRPIDHDLQAGAETIAGVTLELKAIKDTESDLSLTLGFPSDGILITQDLVYNHVHLFLGQKSIDGWIATLQRYKQLPYDKILPGHGLPGGKELYDQDIEYLTFASEQLTEARDGDDLRQRLIAKYPDFHGTALLEHEERFLFKKPT